MYNKDNTTVIIQGNLYPYTKEFISIYRESFKNVILSTWDNEDTKLIECSKIISVFPEKPGGGNINYKIISSLNAIKSCETENCIIVRTDILMEKIDEWLNFTSKYGTEHRLFCLGVYNRYPFSFRDQIFIGKTSLMKSMFSIKLFNEDYYIPDRSHFYPELALCLSYCSIFCEYAKKYYNQPFEYVTGERGNSHESYHVWKTCLGKYIYPVSKYLKYKWPKKAPNGYDFNKEENSYGGERWHENMP
jgi:hypothetical protein